MLPSPSMSRIEGSADEFPAPNPRVEGGRERRPFSMASRAW